MARAAREQLAGRLRIGVIPTVAPYLLPDAVPALRKASVGGEAFPAALRDQLRAKGYKAVFIDREVIDGKPVLRVRIGPEMERARSDQVREKVAREMKLQAVVVSYDGRGTRTE